MSHTTSNAVKSASTEKQQGGVAAAGSAGGPEAPNYYAEGKFHVLFITLCLDGANCPEDANCLYGSSCLDGATVSTVVTVPAAASVPTAFVSSMITVVIHLLFVAYMFVAYQRHGRNTHGVAAGDTESDARGQSPMTEYYQSATPTPHIENEIPPPYSAHNLHQHPASPVASYQIYDDHFGERLTGQYGRQGHGYGRPTYESHPRQNFFNPISHMGYGAGYYGGHRPLRPLSLTTYYDEMAPPRRPGQTQAQASSIPVEYDMYGSGTEMHYAEDPFENPGLEQRRPSSTGTAPITKRKLASPQASAISVNQRMNEEEAGIANPDNALFVLSETSAESEAPSPAKATARGGKTTRARKNTCAGKDPLFDENGRVYKPRRKGRGRPSSGSIRNAPEFESSRAKLDAALKEKNPNGPEKIPSRPTRKALWETHTALSLVSADSVPKASLKKRGISDTGAENVCIKQTGANDPENIRIVNLKDVEGKSFEEIATIINDERIEKGGYPNQKANTVNCRYNRTAPHLYQMQGIPFVRITDRAQAGGRYKYSKEQEKLIWDTEMDDALIEIEHEYRHSKWFIISKKFGKKTGHDWASETEVAVRFSHL